MVLPCEPFPPWFTASSGCTCVWCSTHLTLGCFPTFISNIECEACSMGACLDTALLFEIKVKTTVAAFRSNDLPHSKVNVSGTLPFLW